MLTELHIENIAVIERADIELAPGLNVLTGETGAGKSIIIDAIDAVLGGRASRSLIRTGADRATVSAVFTGADIQSWCDENDIPIEDGDELILTRRFSPDGKGSCRISGTPVPAATVRELGALLLDIHGQNDGRQLLDEARHLDYLDRFGDTSAEFSRFKADYDAYRETVREIERLSMDEAEKERLSDALRYQIDELAGAGLVSGQEAELEARREIMRNAGKLSESAAAAYAALSSGDDSALDSLGSALDSLRRISDMSEALAKTEEVITDVFYTLEDATEQLRDFLNELEFSPEEYDEVELRLQELRRLSRKYGGDEDFMLDKLREFREKLDDMEYADDRLIKLGAELEKHKEAARLSAAELSVKRREAADRLCLRITGELRDLSMPSARFEVEINGRDFDKTGGDEVRFLLSANAGEEPGRISRIASGGELSRIMLAMKNVLAESDAAGTLVFDEIDAGVSGIAAQRVAEKLGMLSRYKQVLCVTHLPQIASMADAHFAIEKTERGGRTYTNVIPLDREGRKQELARLHGGENVTLNTLASAEEQLQAADAYKNRLKTII